MQVGKDGARGREVRGLRGFKVRFSEAVLVLAAQDFRSCLAEERNVLGASVEPDVVRARGTCSAERHRESQTRSDPLGLFELIQC